MVGHLAGIPHWERKIELADRYHYSKDEGLWIDKARPLIGDGETGRVAGATADVSGGFTRINYGCGGNLLDGWLNVDLFPSFAPNYRSVNLLDKHPFRDGTFEFAFSEDVLEHLNQAESIFFLSEIHRTLAPGGVLRLSFPGLEGVLARHYSPMSESAVRRGELEAYSFWDHIHFYSRAELDLVARHVGFTSVTFVEYGTSEHPELAGLDTRATQIGLNTYAELAK
jgi:predicted SAM-dependent methyltransferase